MSTAEELVEVAIELIDEEGREVTFEKVSKVPADEANPHRGSIDRKVTVNQKAVFTDFMVDEVANDRTLESQKKLLTPHIVDSLDQFDFVVDGNKRWKIKNIKTVQPGNTPIMYEMRVAL